MSSYLETIGRNISAGTPRVHCLETASLGGGRNAASQSERTKTIKGKRQFHKR